MSDPTAQEIQNIADTTTKYIASLKKQKKAGLPIKEFFSGTTTVVHTFTEDMIGFGINNKGTGNLTVTINSITLPVDAGVILDEIFDPFTSVTVTGNGSFDAWGRC